MGFFAGSNNNTPSPVGSSARRAEEEIQGLPQGDEDYSSAAAVEARRDALAAIITGPGSQATASHLSVRVQQSEEQTSSHRRTSSRTKVPLRPQPKWARLGDES